MNTSFFTFPILTTDRLILRKVEPNDKDQIFKIRSDQNVNEYIDRAPSSHITEAELHILEIEQLYRDKQGITWVLNQHDHSLFMGSICLWHYDILKASVEIGFYILPEYQRKGFMTEALQECIQFAYDKMEAKAITADVHINNQACIKLLRKFNFLPVQKCAWNPEHMQYKLCKYS